MRHITTDKAKGFSLIEIAVVIFIVSIALVAIATALTSLAVGAREKATRAKQETIKTALITFLVRNNRLPCPAVITTPTGTAGNGVETATPGTCKGATVSGTAPNVVATGAIPWVTLGLPEEASLDAYGNRFTYQVMATATNLTSQTVSGMQGTITIHSAGLGTGANQTNNCATATYNPCGAVVVIVSHGTNGYGAYNNNGAQLPFPATVTGNDERENANVDNKFVVKSYSDIEVNPYDDIVLFLTAGDFLTPLAAQGTVKDYQSALNATMTSLKGAVIANAFASGTNAGGQRRYVFPAALPALPASQSTDPWGMAVIYSRTTTNVDCTTTPLTNTVFTLTSLGQDKVASVDDITVTITVADVVAIIANTGCGL